MKKQQAHGPLLLKIAFMQGGMTFPRLFSAGIACVFCVAFACGAGECALLTFRRCLPPHFGQLVYRTATAYVCGRRNRHFDHERRGTTPDSGW